MSTHPSIILIEKRKGIVESLHPIDEIQLVARSYDAVCTPDFFGFNAKLELQYRGRIAEVRDAKAVPGGKRDLYEAMKSIAETGTGPSHQVGGMGCSIKWRGGQ